MEGNKSNLNNLKKVDLGEESSGKVLRDFPKNSFKESFLAFFVCLLVVLMGVGTGWILSGRASGSSLKVISQENGKTEISEPVKVDESQFEAQSPEGILVEGGIDGEGTHHLERPGGPSQNVYLTSTVVDLQKYVGKKVKVWGNTISGIKAGWLMDVGKIEVIE